jgi:hypothetical protein
MFTKSSAALLDEALRHLSPEQRAETERQLVAAILQGDLQAFTEEAWPLLERYPLVTGKYWQCLSEYLAAVTEGKIKRLIINIPPRMGKSTLVSVLWPAWEWARDQAKSRWLFCTHSIDLALRDSVRRRNLITSPWYSMFWGDSVQLSSDMNLKQEYASTQGGAMFSTWVGGATGRGADRLVIDDPHTIAGALSDTEREATVNFVKQGLFTRLDQPSQGAIVVVMQRLHENVLTGELLNPSRDADTERLVVKEAKSDPPRTGYEMFTRNLRVW